MLPTLREIAMQIAIMHELHPKDTISELAAKLMYSPIFIINALDEGEKMELFSRQKDKDMLVASSGVDYSSFVGTELGQENARVQEEIVRVIASANQDEQDVEDKTLELWLRGIRPSDTEIALHVLRQTGFIATYDLKNPKDKKSHYTFHTLQPNVGKEWGAKQFVEQPKKKSTK